MLLSRSSGLSPLFHGFGWAHLPWVDHSSLVGTGTWEGVCLCFLDCSVPFDFWHLLFLGKSKINSLTSSTVKLCVIREHVWTRVPLRQSISRWPLSDSRVKQSSTWLAWLVLPGWATASRMPFSRALRAQHRHAGRTLFRTAGKRKPGPHRVGFFLNIVKRLTTFTGISPECKRGEKRSKSFFRNGSLSVTVGSTSHRGPERPAGLGFTDVLC